MPAAKPESLHTKHTTKAEKKARKAAEAAMTPRTPLTKEAPAELKGHTKAQKVWQYTIKIYLELSAPIVTSLDLGILSDYCLLVEELSDLEDMRAANREALRVVRENLKKLVNTKTKDPLTIIAQQTAIFEKLETLTEAFYKLDTRADRKRTLIHALRQSLYLTPRARAGAAPAGKEDAPEVDPMEELLNELT